MRYKDFTELWLDNYVRPIAKPRTYEHYKYLVGMHINPYIGDTDMSNVTAIELQHVISELLSRGNKTTNEGLSSNTVNTVITVLQGSFKTAKDIGEIENDPTVRLRRPKYEEKRVECFSVAEQRIIEQAVVEHKKPKMFGILLCLYTGLRIGEILALEWNDIDFEHELLFVNKSCRDNKSGEGEKRIVGSPKTNSSRRVIPLPRQIVSILKEYKDKSEVSWVISDKGHPVSVRSYQRSFELLLKKLDIEHKGFHALRHTFATRAIECGMDVKTLSEILGHKNSTVTLNLYVHSLLEHKREMMNRLGVAL